MKKVNFPFKSEGIQCQFCGKDLTADMIGNVLFVRQCDATGHAIDKIVDVVVVSKDCDAKAQEFYRQEGLNPVMWDELKHYTNPIMWMSFLIRFLDDLKKGNYTVDAAEKMKKLLWETYPYIAREFSELEKEHALTILSI